MGVALDYRCTSNVDGTKAAEIANFINESVPKYIWWSESIGIYSEPPELIGSTKIFLSGYSTASERYREVDPTEDCIMAWDSAKKVLRILSECSKKYGISWDVEVEGQPFGQIAGNEDDTLVFSMADQILMMADLEATDPSLSSRVEQINEKYADRW